MKKIFNAYILTALGLILLGTGLYLIKHITDPQGVMTALPYVFVGIGCGIFGQGMGNLISGKVLKGHPDIEKQIEIERKDERNISISNRSKAKAYDLMIFVFGALMLSFALMDVGLVPLLLLVGAYLFVIGYGVFYRVKYDKEM
jgi:hypothetical protein